MRIRGDCLLSERRRPAGVRACAARALKMSSEEATADRPSFDTDVLIVGGGPTGSTLALALANYGVRAHIVSRSNWLADSPRAHITNQRTMEVFRDLGIGAEIDREASPWDIMGDTLFTTSLAGEELFRLRTWGTGDARRGDYLQASPCGMADIIQPKLEPILFKNAAERGATFAFNTEYVSHEQTPHGVVTKLRERATGREYTMHARYLFGADGAKSAIVEALGLPIEGHMARAGTVYTIFNADLAHYVSHRPSILNWIVTPLGSFGEIGMALLRAVRPWTQWIAGWGFDIAKGDPDIRESTIREGIATMIGDARHAHLDARHCRPQNVFAADGLVWSGLGKGQSSARAAFPPHGRHRCARRPRHIL
jgi:2,4-dichlorophenol 6-monooxygenase